MKFLRRVLCAAAGLVLAAPLLAAPAAAETFNVEGTITSRYGDSPSGRVAFYANCESFAANTPVTRRSFENGYYSVYVPAGTYLVFIDPVSTAPRATESWHTAAPTCDKATPVVVTGDDWIDLVALAKANITGSVTASNGPAQTGSVSFYRSCSDQEAVITRGITAGNYAVTIGEGTYYVRMRPYEDPNGAPGTWTASWQPEQASCAQSTPIVISQDATVDLRARALHAVAATVTSAAGKPSSGRLHAFTNCQDAAAGTKADTGMIGVQAGATTLLLPSGQYYLQFAGTGSSKPALTSWNGAKNTCEQSTPITITGPGAVAMTALSVATMKQPRQYVPVGGRITLPKRTKQRMRITWRVSTKKVCSVRKYRLTGKKDGRCRATATARAGNGAAALDEKFRIAVVAKRQS